jgi:hypothetical protein
MLRSSPALLMQLSRITDYARGQLENVK